MLSCNKYTIPNRKDIKYTIPKKILQRKHQHHLRYANKRYANQDTKYTKQNTKYANQNTKGANLKTKHTLQNTKYTASIRNRSVPKMTNIRCASDVVACRSFVSLFNCQQHTLWENVAPIKYFVDVWCFYSADDDGDDDT